MKNRLLIDFDGTLAEDAWPEWGKINPGAKEAMDDLKEVAELYVFTSRISPVYMDEVTERNADIEILKLRQWLDSNGLGYMHIWTKPWKPHGVAYVDDKAVVYRKRRNSWKHLTPVLRAKCNAAVIDDEGAPDV